MHSYTNCGGYPSELKQIVSCRINKSSSYPLFKHIGPNCIEISGATWQFVCMLGHDGVTKQEIDIRLKLQNIESNNLQNKGTCKLCFVN